MGLSTEANFINHVTLVGDQSWSMNRHKAAFVKAYDNLVKHLAERSRANDQETRITTYLFNDYTGTQCIVWDKDVLRMPSIASSFYPDGGTPLIDATMLAFEDLKLIPQKYGSHAFLTFVLTDGEENRSRRYRASDLYRAINTAPDNHTYAAFVPDQLAVHEAKRFGFPPDNISVWNTSDVLGTEEVGTAMRQATDTFMEGRTRGVHGYNSRSGGGLFKLNDFRPSDVTVAATPLTTGSYYFLDVRSKDRIDDFVERETKKSYASLVGRGYYEFMKTETIQPQKNIAVEVNGQVYQGPQARKVLGLPDDHSVRVKPDQKPGCTIFVQSTSHNRNLVPGTRLLMLR